MSYNISPNLNPIIKQINEFFGAKAKAGEETEIASGKKLYDAPKAVMLSWPERVLDLGDRPANENDEEFLLAEGSVFTQMRFRRGESTYFTARRQWDAYAPIKSLLMADGATEEDFFSLGPTLFPWTYGILTLARRYDKKGKPHLLVGIRSRKLAGRHVGTVSFPGGLVEPKEKLLDAATRQMREECGINLGSIQPGLTIGNHPNAGSTTFMCLAEAASANVTESFEWKGGKAVWASEESVIRALNGDSTAMTDAFRRAGLDVKEGAPIAPDAQAPAKLLLTKVYPIA